MTRSEIIAEHLATLRASVAGGEEDHAHIAFKRVVFAALATPGCEAQGVRLVDLPHLAERVAEMADAHERVVGERDAARTLLNLVSEALSGGEAPVDRLPELVFAMGQRFAAAVDARDAARAERDELAATLANERGEGEPPVSGWTWQKTAHAIATGSDEHGWYTDDLIVCRASNGWVWQEAIPAPGLWPKEGCAPTARAAMRAAAGVKS